MDTRVLTLFDDDFFEQEEPKQKPKKEAAPKAVQHKEPEEAPAHEQAIPEIAVQDEATPVTETVETPAPAQPDEEKEALQVIENAEAAQPPVEAEEPIPATTNEETVAVAETPIAEPRATGQPEEQTISVDTNSVIDEPKNTVPEAITEEEPEVIGERPAEEEEIIMNLPVAEPEQDDLAAADAALNKQILSELIQVDYTALIHRDYPFDMNKATVVQKPAKQEQTPVATIEEEEQEEDEVFEDVVPLPEWNLDKKYYSIGEVAQLFAVNTSHIRFWTNEFKLKPRTTRKGDRLYSPRDIAELRLIHHLVKEKKHTIKGAKEKLKADKTDVNNKLDLKDSLAQLRDTLLQIKAQL